MSDTEVDVIERLFAEFERTRTLSTIREVVARAHLDLQGAPRGALPELVERLARQRLSTTGPQVAGDAGDAGA